MLEKIKGMLAGKKVLMGVAGAIVAIISNLMLDQFGIELSDEVKQNTILAISAWLAFAVADRTERKSNEVKEIVVEAVNKAAAMPAKDTARITAANNPQWGNPNRPK